MIQRIRADDRFHIESDWLSAYWLFSFDRYYDPENVSFGPLRVFNHDTVQPAAGFPTHSHREMEIVTYVLEGELTHKDSTGGRGVIRSGEVQRMTAGTGVAHSEINASVDQPVKLLQMWVLPSESGLTPSYEQRRFSTEDRTGILLPIASGEPKGNAIHIHQDATFFVALFQKEKAVTHELSTTRRAFVYIIEGAIALNGERFEKGDQARISGVANLSFEASEESEIILIDLP